MSEFGSSQKLDLKNACRRLYEAKLPLDKAPFAEKNGNQLCEIIDRYIKRKNLLNRHAIEVLDTLSENPEVQLKDLRNDIICGQILKRGRGIQTKRNVRHCFVCDDSGVAELVSKTSLREKKFSCLCPVGETKRSVYPQLQESWNDWLYTEDVLKGRTRFPHLCLKDSREHFEALGLNYDDYLPGGKIQREFQLRVVK